MSCSAVACDDREEEGTSRISENTHTHAKWVGRGGGGGRKSVKQSLIYLTDRNSFSKKKIDLKTLEKNASFPQNVVYWFGQK